MAKLKGLLKSRSKPRSRDAEIGKLALTYAEQTNREISLGQDHARALADAARIQEELKSVSAAKAETLRLLASGTTGDGALPAADGNKESVFKLIASMPTHIFTTAEVIKTLRLNRSTASVYLSVLSEKDRRIRRVKKGQYQALSGGGSTTNHPVLPTPIAASEAMPDRVLALLESEQESTFTAPVISKRFGFSSPKDLNAVRNALSRLGRDGKIEKVAHGKYRALPGRRKM